MIVVGHAPRRHGVARYGDKTWMMKAELQLRLGGVVRRSRQISSVTGLTQAAAWARARDLAADIGLNLTMPPEDD